MTAALERAALGRSSSGGGIEAKLEPQSPPQIFPASLGADDERGDVLDGGHGGLYVLHRDVVGLAVCLLLETGGVVAAVHDGRAVPGGVDLTLPVDILLLVVLELAEEEEAAGHGDEEGRDQDEDDRWEVNLIEQLGPGE